MLGISDKLTDHCLYDTYIAIERTAEKTAKQCKPEVHGKPHQQEGSNGTEAAYDQYWLSANSIRK